MTEGYTMIGTLLQTTYTAADNTLRKQAEDKLQELSQKHEQMIPDLLALISSVPDQNLRQSAATRLRQLVRSLLEQSAFSSMQKCSLAEQIFQVLIQSVPKSVGETLGSLLTGLVSDSSNGLVATKLSGFCSQHLRGSANEVLGSLICVKSLFSVVSNDFSTKDYFDKLLPFLHSVGQTLLQQVIQCEESAAPLLSVWSDTFSQILEHFEMISPKTMKLFLRQSSIAEVFLGILGVNQSESLSSPSSSPTSKELIKSKTGVLKCLNIILQYTIDQKKKLIEEQEGIAPLTTLIGMDLPDSPFISAIWNYFPHLLNLILGLGKETVLSNIYEEFKKEFVKEAIDLMQKACGESRFFSVFLGYYQEIIAFIVISSFRYSDEEKDLVQRDPQEFVDLGIDICERQDSDTVKTSSARLLETLCDNIDGALSYVISLIKDQFISIFQPRVENQSNPLIYSFSLEEEEQLDCSFLMLNTLNYSISKRKDLINTLDALFASYQSILINTRSAIIQSRLGLFLYFFIEHIHQSSETRFFTWVNFLVDCMTPANPYAAGIIQACETFTSVTQDEETMLRIHDFIHKIFDKLVTCIPSQTQRRFFESFGDFLNWFSEISHQQILTALSELVKKILVEVQVNKMLAGKCWNVVRAILSSEFLLVDKMAEYEQVVTPVFQLLQFPELLSFEDDIISVVLTSMVKTKKVSMIQWEVLGILPHYQTKQEGSLQGLLKLISSFIQYGRVYMQDNPGIIEVLCGMGIQALNCQKAEIVKENLCSEGATLLQLLLASFPGYLDNLLPEILHKTLLRYISPPIQFHYFKIRLLQVFLASFSYNFELTTKLLQQSLNQNQITLFRYIVLEISQNFHGFRYEHDRKIAMIGFGHLLCNLNFNAETREMAEIVFEVLIMIMSNKAPLENLQNKKLNILLDKIMTEDIDAMTDSEIIVKGTRLMMNEAANQSSEESEAMIGLMQVMTIFNEYDEFVEFKDTLKFLDKNYTEWVRKRISSLTEERRQELIQIVASQKVKPIVPGSNAVVRKIVKPRRSK